MQKTCKKCKIPKKTNEFYKGKSKGKNGQVWDYFDPYCKVCRLEYAHTRRRSIKQQAINYLGGKCSMCNLKDKPCVYDFHHTDPSQKDLAIADSNSKSFETLKPELDKCVLLCANCHRKLHSRD